MSSSAQLAHVVFPADLKRRRALNLEPNAGRIAPAPRTQVQLTDEEHRLLAAVFSQAGLPLEAYRNETLQRRIPACQRALRASSMDEAVRAVERMPLLAEIALGALLVGVSSFFRDASVFEMLRTVVVPSLVNRRGLISVWSAGCSDGAELYSVAILLAEAGLLGKSYLVGTDCRRDAIERAKLGRYGAGMLSEVPGELREKYFAPVGDQVRICEPLRNHVRFHKANLLDHQPGCWDLILFRNTAMYMRPKAISTLWLRLEGAIRPGGYLVLGKAERPQAARRLIMQSPSVYRRAEHQS